MNWCSKSNLTIDFGVVVWSVLTLVGGIWPTTNPSRGSMTKYVLPLALVADLVIIC